MWTESSCVSNDAKAQPHRRKHNRSLELKNSIHSFKSAQKVPRKLKYAVENAFRNNINTTPFKNMKIQFKTNMTKQNFTDHVVCKKVHVMSSLIWQSGNTSSLLITLNGHQEKENTIQIYLPKTRQLLQVTMYITQNCMDYLRLS